MCIRERLPMRKFNSYLPYVPPVSEVHSFLDTLPTFKQKAMVTLMYLSLIHIFCEFFVLTALWNLCICVRLLRLLLLLFYRMDMRRKIIRIRIPKPVSYTHLGSLPCMFFINRGTTPSSLCGHLTLICLMSHLYRKYIPFLTRFLL